MQEHCPDEDDPADWRLQELKGHLGDFFGLDANTLPIDFEGDSGEDIREGLWAAIQARYAMKMDRLGVMMTQFERWVCLQVLDSKWKDHLYALDRLKEGIGLRGYGQRNPLVEYKRESFDMFQTMNDRAQAEMVRCAFRMEPMTQEEQDERLAHKRAIAERSQHVQQVASTGGTGTPVKTRRVVKKKIGRNMPCPCGSGKKYKKCCGFK